MTLWLFPMEALKKKKCVIYDDYWVAKITEAYIEKMLFRLDRVDVDDMKTIITTNLSIDEIKKRDQRLYSRMMKNAQILIITWPDRRLSNTIIL